MIRVRIRRASTLAGVKSTRRHVKEVVDDTSAHECVAGTVEIDTPWIARPIGKNFEFFGSRMIPGNCGVHSDGVCIRIIRVSYLGMGKDALSHVEPSIRSPGKAVEEFMTVIEAEARLEHGLFVGMIIAISIFEKKEIRRLAISQGMRTLLEEALSLVNRDVTTISEVIRGIYAT